MSRIKQEYFWEKSRKIEDLEKKYSCSWMSFVDGGCHGKIYSLGEKNANIVGKFLRAIPALPFFTKDEGKLCSLRRECFVQEKASKVGLKVAKPFEVYNVLYMGLFKQDYFPALVMEKLDGIPVVLLGGKSRKEATELMKKEIRKAKDLGFKPWYVDERNCLWLPKGEIRLVDFDDWEMEDYLYDI